MDASIVIPTHNRRAVLLQTLGAMSRLVFSGTWEIVVVDDGSTDETVAAVESWRRGVPQLAVDLLAQANAGPAAARNHGAKRSRGRYIVFVDDDIEVRPDFLELHTAALRSHPGCWVMGRVVQRPELRGTPFGRYRDDLWEAFHARHAPDRVSPTDGNSATNLSMPREDFERLGGFDEAITIASCEDMLFCRKARQAGIEVLYHPGIVAIHLDWASTLDAFCERQWLYSISDVAAARLLGAESPRFGLVRENGPVALAEDGVRLAAKKAIKAVLSLWPFRRSLYWTTRLVERLRPDSPASRKLYEANTALAVFRGVREGFRRYPPTRPSPSP